MYQTFIADKEYKYAYKFLKDLGLSERYLSFLRKKMGNIKINGNSVTIKAELKQGDKLDILADNSHKTTIMQCILPLDIVYEDAYYLLVNKPAGISTIPSRSHYTENLSGAIAHYLSKDIENLTIRAVNRLDNETAGLVLFAKNLLAYNLLKDTQKTYYALCKGIIDKSLVIDYPIETIKENGINQRKRIVSQNGKPAQTFVSPVKTFDDCSLVKINLVHGRTHQIRVHLSYTGHPLIGDTLYGETDPQINHTALLCKEFTFFHPFEKKPLTLSVDFPDDFKKFIIN